MEAYALFDVVANRLGEIKAEKFLRDSGLCGEEGTYQHDAPKLEGGAQKDGETLTDVKGVSLFLTLAATLAMGRSQDGWQNTGRHGGQGTGLHAC